MTRVVKQITRRAALKAGLLATGARAAGVSIAAWFLQACGGGKGSGTNYGNYGNYGYGSSLASPRVRWASRHGPRRVVGS